MTRLVEGRNGNTRNYAAASLAIIMLGLAVAASVKAADPATETLLSEVVRAMEERANLGLQADEATVSSLLGSDRDVGTPRWGIPMTVAEEAQIDPIGRMRYADDVDNGVLAYARSLPTFAGAYIDQQRLGRLVILLTAADPELEAKLRSLAPADGPDINVQYVPTSFVQLHDAYDRVWTVWPLHSADALYSVAIDERRNQFLLRSDVAEAPARGDLATAIGESLGVDVAVIHAGPPVELVCNHPDNCYNPMKAGTRIRKGSTGGTICTMGFHIIKPSNGDRELLTAGHCGYSGSNNWYHTYYGFVGAEEATQYYEGGRDVMRVEIPNSQISNDIYEWAADVEGSGNPIAGEFICTRLGKTNAGDCGNVEFASTSWGPSGTACGCKLYGASAVGLGLATTGDSGSPIFRNPYTDAAIGVGILNIGLDSGSVGFARLRDSLEFWGFGVYTTD
jgi:hypothetical protein